MLLVGRWGRAANCATTSEFRADGTMTNHRGETATWSATGSPPVVTINVPGGALVGTLEQTPQGVQIRGRGPGEILTLYRCGSGPAAQPGGGSGGAVAVAPPPPPASSGAGDRPPRMTGGSVSDADYPASAIRSGAQGTTRVRLQISEAGLVTGCSVIGSSGNSALDSTTCSLMQRRFRFEPAVRNGRPAASEIERSQVWRLPGD
jgi:protein TonB